MLTKNAQRVKLRMNWKLTRNELSIIIFIDEYSYEWTPFIMWKWCSWHMVTNNFITTNINKLCFKFHTICNYVIS
jgi:hypothetical protein